MTNNNEIQKLCITVNDTDYEAVIKEDLIDENCCSMCDLNSLCNPDSQIAYLCGSIEDTHSGCGCYFIEV